MRKNITKAVLLVLVAGYGAAGLAACNTVEGAGKDVKNTGNTIEDSARNAK
ncbi:MAG TPA: entericidin A/B family lipoprotein [Parvibaculum sp.]|jgi:predicted small secreted protein